jgi:ATP-binding cassette subfamily F protein uup
MLNQRGFGVTAKEATKNKAPRTGEAKERRKADTRRKLTFSNKHALETLPARITKLEGDILQWQKRLSDGAFYARDPKGFAELSEKLKTAQSELESSEQRWLELEMLREEIERA